MEHFANIRRVILGDLQPHKINEDDLSLIKQEFKMILKESDDGIQIEPHRYLPLFSNKAVILNIDDESNMTIYEDNDEQLEELIDINIPPPPDDEKSECYRMFIDFEYEIIKLKLKSYISDEVGIKKLELLVLRNTYELRDLAMELNTYYKRLPKNTSESNKYVMIVCKNYIIKIYMFIQENFSLFFPIEYKSQFRLRYELFGEDFSYFMRSPIHSIFPKLPKEDKYNRLKSSYMEDYEKYRTTNPKIFQDFYHSFAEYAFNFYKNEFKSDVNLYKKEKMFWEELLILNKLKIPLINDKQINHPEIEKALLPLLELEIKHLEDFKNKSALIGTEPFDFGKLTKEIIEILIKMFKRFAGKKAENYHNDYLSDFLQERNYIVDNQSRIGNQLIDVEIQKANGTTISIIEGLILSSLNRNYIYEHLYKLLNIYDKTGNPVNYMIVYAKTNKYADLWQKYLGFLKEINDYKNGIKYSILEVKDRCDELSQSDIFFAESIHNRNNKQVSVYHIFVNIKDLNETNRLQLRNPPTL